MIELDNKILLPISEPPVIVAVRKNFSTVAVFLSAIFGLLSTALLPVFFKTGIKTENLRAFVNSFFLKKYAVLLPDFFFYLSLLVAALLSADDFKPMRPARFTPVQFFLSLTAIGQVYVLFSAAVQKIKYNRISLVKHITALDNYGILLISSFALALLCITVYAVCIGRIKYAIKFNQPRKGCAAVTAVLFLLLQLFKSYVLIDEVMVKNNTSAERFRYGAVTGTSLCTVLNAAAAVLFAVLLFKYITDISAIKKKYMRGEKSAE